MTLSESSTQKNELHEKIRESQEKIGSKRKQMEEIREDLRVLGQCYVSVMSVLDWSVLGSC